MSCPDVRLRRAERHRPAAHFAVVVALLHRIVIARIAFAAACSALTVPAAAAITPDLRIQVRELSRPELQWEDDVRRIDETVRLAAAPLVLLDEFARRMIRKAYSRGRRRLWLILGRFWRLRCFGTSAVARGWSRRGRRLLLIAGCRSAGGNRLHRASCTRASPFVSAKHP